MKPWLDQFAMIVVVAFVVWSVGSPSPWRWLQGFTLVVLLIVAACLFSGCVSSRPQRGGTSTTSLGGTAGPTVLTNQAPENPQTPSTTTVEKTTTRTYEIPPKTEGTAIGPVTSSDRQGFPRREHLETAPSQDVGLRDAPVAAQSPAPRVVTETVVERATTQTGAAQKDTTRELTARLANTRGVLWVGVLLLIGGPIIGAKMGWFTNGLIAGGVGLLLVILSTVLPGNEAWFGLGGLCLIPLVAFVYYRAHHDANNANSKS